MTETTYRVIVTGADSTARTIVETFAQNGHSVSACDVRPDATQALAADNPGVFAQQANMGVEADVKTFMDAAIKHMGGVDFLINVVGIAGPTKPTEEISSEEWAQSIAVNLTGVFLTSQVAIPYLKKQKFGGIVNFSSASTRTLLPNRSPYIVTKYGVEGLTRNLARELGPHNVRANAILPGGIDNARLRSVVEKSAQARGVSVESALEESLQYTSMRSLITTKELADTIYFLCSDAGRHISGQLIGVDGNMEWEE